MSFQPGELAGDYQILDLLGKGGMGRVYRVRNLISERIEALKVLLEDVGSDPAMEDRFISEIRILARLDHPNIAKLNTAFKVDKRLVMIMELVEGVDLAERLRQSQIPLDKVLDYMQQVLAALSYAHNHGVIHRDVKPSNIMVTAQGVVKLMDFGIAKSTAEPLQTGPGATVGSLLYMSPEQARGTGVDARSDLYSVGVMLYELTVGRPPFESDNTYAILNAHLNSPPPPPIQINPSLPPALNEVILTVLQKDPAMRFQNADALGRVLKTISASYAPTAPRVPADTAAATVISGIGNGNPGHPQASAPKPVSPPPAPPARPAPPQQQRKQGKRGLWMAAGAIACVCVLIGAAIVMPQFRRSSASSSPDTASSQSAVSAPPAAATPDASQPAQNAPAVADTPAPSQANAEPEPVRVSTADVPVANAPKPKIVQSAQPVEPVKLKALPAEAHNPEAPAVVKTVVKEEGPATPPAPAQTQTATATGPSEADLNNAGEALMEMQARAQAVHQSLDGIRQQQAADGLGLRGDIAASDARLGSFLQMADRQLQSGNLDGAQRNMDRAKEELVKLEKFLGR